MITASVIKELTYFQCIKRSTRNIPKNNRKVIDIMFRYDAFITQVLTLKPSLSTQIKQKNLDLKILHTTLRLLNGGVFEAFFKYLC